MMYDIDLVARFVMADFAHLFIYIPHLFIGIVLFSFFA